MKYFQLLILIVSVLGFYITNVKSQNTTTAMPGEGDTTTAMPGEGDTTTAMPGEGDTTTAMPGEGDTTTAMPGAISPNQPPGPQPTPGDQPAPPTAPNQPPGPQPTPGDQPAPPTAPNQPPGPQPTPGGQPAPPTAPLVNPSIAQYLNNRIKQVLSENPPRNSAQLNLASLFNEKRALLEAALIGENPQKDDDLVAERALENFRNFLQDYEDIEDKLESAIEQVTKIERDPNRPVDQRYEALSVLTQLRDSASIRAAERALRNYQDFIDKISNGGAKPQTPTPTNPNLTDEYRRYFEEILKILRKFYKDEDPKMQTILQQILKDPWQLKKLAAALKELSEEDYDEDYFWDWFSFW